MKFSLTTLQQAQGIAGQGTAGHGRARQNGAGHGKTEHGRAGHGKTEHGRAGRGKTEHGTARARFQYRGNNHQSINYFCRSDYFVVLISIYELLVLFVKKPQI